MRGSASPNGIRVAGLDVLIGSRERSALRQLVDGLLLFNRNAQDLTVEVRRDGQVVTARGVRTLRQANRLRQEFVRLVESMSPSEAATIDAAACERLLDQAALAS